MTAIGIQMKNEMKTYITALYIMFYSLNSGFQVDFSR